MLYNGYFFTGLINNYAALVFYTGGALNLDNTNLNIVFVMAFGLRVYSGGFPPVRHMA